MTGAEKSQRAKGVRLGSLLTTRLNPPQFGQAQVRRSELMRLLAKYRDVQTVVLQAPAGYSKTTTLVTLHTTLRRREQQCVWLSLDGFSDSAAEFMHYLIYAVQQERPHFGRAALEVLNSEQAEDALPGATQALFNALAELEAPLHVFLDDWHAVRESGVERWLSAWIEHLPPNVKLYLSTRETPGLPIGRLTATHRLVQVTTEHLRFNEVEARELLDSRLPHAVAPWVSQLAYERTEGWAAGLQLVSISLADEGFNPERLRSLDSSNRHVTTFLAEQILHRLPSEVQDFLLETCVLDRFSVPLANAVGERPDGRAMLDRVQHSGLFLLSLDAEGQWYRYHHLFKSFLLTQLRDVHPGREELLRMRATRWLIGQGLIPEAVQQAVGMNDPAQVAATLNDIWEKLMRDGQFWVLAEWIRGVPAEVVDQFPRLQLISIWAITCQWQFEEAAALLTQFKEKLASWRASGRLDPQEADELRLMALHREMMLAQFQDDHVREEALCGVLVEHAGQLDAYLMCTTHLSLHYAKREQYRPADFDLHDGLARKYYRLAGSEYVQHWHQTITGPAQMQLGHPRRAEDGYRQTLNLTAQYQGEDSAFMAGPALLLGDALLEQGQLTEAARWFRRFLPRADEVGFVDQLIAGHVGLARIASFHGNRHEASATLDEGLLRAQQFGFPRLLWSVRLEQLRQLHRRREYDRLRQLGEEYGLAELAPALLRPHAGMTTLTELQASAWAYWRLAFPEDPQVEELITAWMHFTERIGYLRSRIMLGRLKHHVLLRRTGKLRSDRFATSEVQHFTSTGLIFPFAEDGLVPLLPEDPLTLSTDPAPALEVPPRQDSRDAERAEARQAVAALSEREVEIIRLMWRGLRNKDIGDSLGMTEGTVKWHLQQIFDKLGVRRRTQVLHVVSLGGLLEAE